MTQKTKPKEIRQSQAGLFAARADGSAGGVSPASVTDMGMGGEMPVYEDAVALRRGRTKTSSEHERWGNKKQREAERLTSQFLAYEKEPIGDSTGKAKSAAPAAGS